MHRRKVDPAKIEEMRGQVAALLQRVQAIEQGKSFRLLEGLRRVPKQLFGSKPERRDFWAWVHKSAPSDGRFQPVRQLEAMLAELDATLAAVYDTPPPRVAAFRVWDGHYGAPLATAFYEAMEAWREAVAGACVADTAGPADTAAAESETRAPVAAANATPSAHTGIPLLLPRPAADGADMALFAALRAALEAAGFFVVEVAHPQEDAPGCVSASEAVRRYAGGFVCLACLDATCAPFLDGFPNKLLLFCDTGEAPCKDSPGCLALLESMRRQADVVVPCGAVYEGAVPQAEEAPPQTLQAGAAQFAQLAQERLAHLRDIVVLSTINYSFLAQRPQHLARLAAEAGHRVFFINADAGACGTRQLEKLGNLRVIEWAALGGTAPCTNIYDATLPSAQAHLQNEVRAILCEAGVRDAAVKVEYPLWAGVGLALQKDCGFTLLYDVLDDYAGFPGAQAIPLQTASEVLMAQADAVVATSGLLWQQAQGVAKEAHLIRNGAECAHFRRAAARAAGEGAAGTRVVGYYGVLSAWFEVGIIRALATSDLDVEIRLIGVAQPAVAQQLAGLPKVRLLPPVPYAELPEALAGFDVCIIPFDAKSELIKATDPVKFYEYLSAGKKVVATEIPELAPYRGTYAYLENDPAQFVLRVRQCLAGEDDLAPPEACMRFAQQNDWASRARQYEALFRVGAPRQPANGEGEWA